MSACPHMDFVKIFTWKSFDSLEQDVGHREHLNIFGSHRATPLHNAAKNSDPRVAKFVLSKNVDVNARDVNMQTPLHYACEYLNMNVVKMLIESGVDIFAEDERGENALHFALHEAGTSFVESLHEAGYAHWDLIQVLIDNGLDINSRDLLGHTPIFYAALSSDADLMQKLIDNGADINVITKQKMVPIQYSTISLRTGTLGCLLNNGSVVDVADKFYATPLSLVQEDAFAAENLIQFGASVRDPMFKKNACLQQAAERNATALIEVFLKYGADVNAVDETGNTALLATFKNWGTNEKSMPKLLLNQGANVNCRNSAKSTALTEVIKHRDWETMKELMERGAELTDVLFEACTAGIEFVKYFIERGVDPKSAGHRNTFPIHVAASSGDLELLKHLVDLGCDVSSRDAHHDTPVHKAVSSYNCEEICEYLLEKGADVNATNIDNRTPLYNLYDHAYLEILRRHGAVVNSRDIAGNTPFHIFCRDSPLVWVETLVGAGADIKALNDKRESGLHMAASSDDLDKVKYLVKLGLDINGESDDRGIPLHYATANDIRSFLSRHGCETNTLNDKGETELFRNILSCSSGEDIDKYSAKREDINQPNAQGVTPLHRACQEKSEQLWKRTMLTLLEKGADKWVVDKRGRSILHHACQYSDLKVVEKILELDVPLDSTDYENKNVLHYAAENGDIELVRYIYGRIPSLNCPDNNGHPPLYYCTSRRVGDFLMPRTYNIQPKDMNRLLLDGSCDDDPFPVLRKLINLGASVNTADDLGNTPLHFAALSGSCKAIRLLLDAGASINVLNKDLQSPIYSAVTSNNLDAVKLLVTAGADINKTNRKHCSPQQFAWLSSSKIANYLLSKVPVLK